MSKEQENLSENKSTPKPRKTRARKKPAAKPQPKGLGDKVEAVLNSEVLAPITKAIKEMIWKDGEDCGCEERKIKLNNLFKKSKPRCINEEQHKYLAEWLPKTRSEIEFKQMYEFSKIHAGVFNYHFEGVCSSCASQNKRIIEDLRVVLAAYVV